jgi:hypothetical protein
VLILSIGSVPATCTHKSAKTGSVTIATRTSIKSSATATADGHGYTAGSGDVDNSFRIAACAATFPVATSTPTPGN